MKKLFSFLFAALLPVVASAYGGQILPDARINGIYYNFSGDEAIVTYKLFDASYGTFESGYTGDVVNGGTGISLPASEGKPNLPSFSRFVAVPNGASAHVEMGYRSMTTIANVDLLPATPIKFDTDDSPNTYEKDLSIYNKNAFFPDWSNITFRNITCIGSKQAVEIQGLKGKPVHNILFDNVMIIGNKKGIKMEFAEDLRFENCNINPKPMPVEEYKKCKNIRYNGKDPDAAE